jgi:protein ECT2
MSVVLPPSQVNLDPMRTEEEKRRFLENLWAVQARYRTRFGQSVILRSEEREVEDRAGKITTARTYFNLYQRTAYMKERAKVGI